MNGVTIIAYSVIFFLQDKMTLLKALKQWYHFTADHKLTDEVNQLHYLKLIK